MTRAGDTKFGLTAELRLEKFPPHKVVGRILQIVAFYAGLCVRSNMNAGQDGFRDASS